MERLLKFRGKSIDTGKWVYGGYHKPFDDVVQIIEHIKSNASQMTLVDESTVGQFTGLRDKHGVEIYEGDTLNFRANYTNKPCGYFNGIVKITPYNLVLVVGELEYAASEEAEGIDYSSEVVTLTKKQLRNQK